LKTKVKVEKILYYNNGWGLFGCSPLEWEGKIEKNKYGNITIKGNTPIELIEGEVYTFDLGEIERSSKGDSYPILKMYIEKAISSKAQYMFLENLLSPKQYRNLLEKYPKSKEYKILDMIENNEIDLTEIHGIGEKTAKKIKENIFEYKDHVQVINRLSPIGVSMNTINKIINHFGSPQTVIRKINQSIYNLCQVKGLGFITVDKYALNDGERKDSFKRIEACINYLIHKEVDEGHSWIPYDDLIQLAIKMLDIEKEHIEEFLQTLDFSDSNIININNKQISTQFYYNQEQLILTHLKRINENYKLKFENNNLLKFIRKAENELGIKYTDEQLETILESFNYGVYIINGKGGVGKSVIIKAITTICENLNLNYLAMALSGRATQLLINKGIKASTIHRGLGYDGKEFKFNEYCKLPYDVIILEESSMDNAYLWNIIVSAIKNGSKLIIVGDSGQLSAIGNGDVLRDLLQTQYFKCRELKQIHRQAQDSGIIELANKVREGIKITGWNYELGEVYGVNKDLYLFTYKQKETMLEKAKEFISKRVSKLTKDNILDFQILVANKDRGAISVLEINKYCQSIYNNLFKKHLKTSKYTYIIDDKVINSGNKYRMNVYESVHDYWSDNPVIDKSTGEPLEVPLYNGTMGIVVDLCDERGKESLLVKFEGIDYYIKIEKKDLPSVELAYAISIHRSQGMTIKETLVLIDFSAFKLLSKQLLYTAITRASERCVILAENNALLKCCTTDNSGERRTFLKDFILEEINNKKGE